MLETRKQAHSGRWADKNNINNNSEDSSFLARSEYWTQDDGHFMPKHVEKTFQIILGNFQGTV
jgi:hypothetical protein